VSTPTHIYRTCTQCGVRYEIDAQELADGTYSPLCTDCLRDRCESNQMTSTPEKPVGENN